MIRTSRTASGRRGVTLIDVMFCVTLMGLLSALAAQSIARNARIQSRAVAWAADDMVMQDVLRRIRSDAESAVAARTESAPTTTIAPSTAASDDASPMLVLDTNRGEVRYRDVGGAVERVGSGDEDAPVRHEWSLHRTRVRWVVEPGRDGESVVWTRVQITDPVNPAGSPMMHQYAAAWRVGGREVRR